MKQLTLPGIDWEEGKKNNPPVINYIEKTREKYNDPILENRGKQTVAINHTSIQSRTTYME